MADWLSLHSCCLVGERERKKERERILQWCDCDYLRDDGDDDDDDKKAEKINKKKRSFSNFL